MFDLSIRAGSSFHDHGGEVIDVAAKKEHEECNVNDKSDCDICLLKLTRILVFGENVAAIPVIKDYVEIPLGTIGIATGWGRKSVNLTHSVLNNYNKKRENNPKSAL